MWFFKEKKVWNSICHHSHWKGLPPHESKSPKVIVRNVNNSESLCHPLRVKKNFFVSTIGFIQFRWQVRSRFSSDTHQWCFLVPIHKKIYILTLHSYMPVGWWVPLENKFLTCHLLYISEKKYRAKNNVCMRLKYILYEIFSSLLLRHHRNGFIRKKFQKHLF